MDRDPWITTRIHRKEAAFHEARTDPIKRDFSAVREAPDRIVEESLVWPFVFFEGPPTTFAVDLSETTDGYVLKASIPGVKTEDIDSTATADSVSVAGEYKSETTVKGPTYLRQERQAGVFKRSFSLRLPIDPEKIETVQADGIVTITMPRAGVTKPARVQLKAKG